MTYNYLEVIEQLYNEYNNDYYRRLIGLQLTVGKRLDQHDIDVIDTDEIMMANVRRDKHLRCVISVEEPNKSNNIIYMRRYTMSDNQKNNINDALDTRMKNNIIIYIVDTNDMIARDVLLYTKTHRDTIHVCNIFLNSNSMYIYELQSREMMNRDKMMSSGETLHRHEYVNGDVYIGDVVMFALGLRSIVKLEKYGDSRTMTHVVRSMKIPEDVIAYDPRYFFYYMGHKVILLDIEVCKKIARSIVKDTADLIIMYFKCRPSLKMFMQLDDKTGRFKYHDMFETNNKQIHTAREVLEYLQRHYPTEYISDFNYDVIKALMGVPV